MSKTITFSIPCYNSAEYMDRCIESILCGTAYSDDVEILVVDDGSTKDDTPAKADEWQGRYPQIIRAVHQENGGHGIAVMSALERAQGLYFKNVDSDDWVSEKPVQALLEQLRAFEGADEAADLVITNFVYEHVQDGSQNVVRFDNVLPCGEMFGWDEIGHFSKRQYLLMHSLTYRTELLRKADLQLPAHTFYVDNIYAYTPLPLCKRLFYLDVDLYRYFIGRDDQSVNEDVLTSRIDHYWRVARMMIGRYHIFSDVWPKRLQDYMMDYLTIILGICSVFSKKSERADAQEQMRRLWDELKAYDEHMYSKAKHGAIGLAANIPGRTGRVIASQGYRIAQKMVKFN